MNGQKVFYETLKMEFAPRLREVGFRGSGRDFRRIRGDVFNVVNVQGFRWGGKCALNIGLHFVFLPTASENLLEAKTIKEFECEFRRRVTPSGESDFWWEYGSSSTSAQRSARHLIATYFAVGEQQFQRFAAVDAIVRTCPIEFLKSRNHSFYGDTSFGHLPCTVSRMALAMARIHEHLGNFELAKEFAIKGLENMGNGTSLIPRFQRIINLSQPP
jgi:hypothetical protein